MKRRIMVVDDDSNTVAIIRDELKKLDDEYEIVSADNGEDCIGLLHDNNIPDLILLDVMMPGMDGIDVFKNLKENRLWKKIPTVFLVDSKNGFNKFFIDKILGKEYILKPFDPDMFVALIEQRLRDTGAVKKRGKKT